MPDYFSLFTDLFIALASVMGIVFAVQGRAALDGSVRRATVIAIFAMAFLGCAFSVSPYILSDFGLADSQVWRTLSYVAVVGALIWMPLLYSMRRRLSASNLGGRRILTTNMIFNAAFGGWLLLNGLGVLGPPKSAPLGMALLYIFALNAVAFVRFVVDRKANTESP